MRFRYADKFLIYLISIVQIFTWKCASGPPDMTGVYSITISYSDKDCSQLPSPEPATFPVIITVVSKDYSMEATADVTKIVSPVFTQAVPDIEEIPCIQFSVDNNLMGIIGRSGDFSLFNMGDVFSVSSTCAVGHFYVYRLYFDGKYNKNDHSISGMMYMNLNSGYLQNYDSPSIACTYYFNFSGSVENNFE